MIGSRLRRAGTVAALTLALLATVAVAPAAAAPREAAAESYIDRVTILVSYEGVYRGYIQISVYAAGHRKHLVVCDENGDYAEPTLQVDAGPNQVSYQDPNGSHAGCLEHDIWYGVRKFRVGFHKEGDATHALAWDSWFNRELLRIHGVCGCRSWGRSR